MQNLLTVVLLLVANLLLAQEGHKIKVVTSNVDAQQAYLGYFLGDNQFVMDTAVSNDGAFVFENNMDLDAGYYMVVFPPDNNYFQFLVSGGNDNIDITVEGSDIQHPKKITGSPDTRLFYDYAEFIAERRPQADALRGKLESATNTEKKEIEAQLADLNDAVEDKQNAIIAEAPASLTAMLIKANKEIGEPELSGTEEERSMQAYLWYKEHYFDHIDLTDPRIARTPFASDKINYYLDKLCYQKPDSLNEALDYILAHFDKEGEAFRVYLVQFLNKYAKSKIVGMDAVYVHLVDNYYAKGLATWADDDQVRKIVENANVLRPILLGKKAPNITLQDRQKTKVTLHDIEAPFTVLFFWDPECGHCKKSIPKLIDFYDEYNDKGVEILAVCTKLGEGEESCWDAVDERGMNIWLNASDPYLRSRFKQIYDIRLTPQIFVLDQDKTIIMKKIGVEKLPEVIDHFQQERSN